MQISPLLLIIVIFVGVFIFIAGSSKYFGSGANLETVGSILGSILTQMSSPTNTTSFTKTTTQFNQTKCILSGGKCIQIVPVSPLKCKLEFFDEAFCGKGWKCCIPR